MALYIRDSLERKRLELESRDATAYLSEEELSLTPFQNTKTVEAFLSRKELLDLACMDVGKEEDIGLLKKMRSLYQKSELFLVADSKISPMEYLTPEIKAASLLLRPYGEEECKRVLYHFFRSFYQSREKKEETDILVLENRDGKTKIPFHLIYYIEVREKKLFIRLQNKEYTRYDSLENLLKILPDTFLQCHRSFVFNTEYFVSVKLSENRICLEQDIYVPLSRSFKPKMKEFINGLHPL